jgi:hypothetical protein
VKSSFTHSTFKHGSKNIASHCFVVNSFRIQAFLEFILNAMKQKQKVETTKDFNDEWSWSGFKPATKLNNNNNDTTNKSWSEYYIWNVEKLPRIFKIVCCELGFLSNFIILYIYNVNVIFFVAVKQLFSLKLSYYTSWLQSCETKSTFFLL